MFYLGAFCKLLSAKYKVDCVIEGMASSCLLFFIGAFGADYLNSDAGGITYLVSFEISV
jgi:hypothetical protein